MSNAVWDANPRYWAFDGKAKLLLGATVDRVLFLSTKADIKAHLDELESAGGNFLRVSLGVSGSESGIPAFAQTADGQFDLTRWNQKFWNQLKEFLDETARRRIVVQVEIWDAIEFFGEAWETNPFNPRNTSTYSASSSKLPTELSDEITSREHPFFQTVPKLANNTVVLSTQEAFVSQALSICRDFRHVIYSIDSETDGPPEWGEHWATVTRTHAESLACDIHVTEMWKGSNLRHVRHRHTNEHPETYAYCDASPATELGGDDQWDGCQWLWHRISDSPRPLNISRICGSDDFSYEVECCDADHALTSFWRAVIGGYAAACFDENLRSGIGFNKETAAQIRAVRLVEEVFDFSRSVPDSFHALLADRVPGEAYAAHIPNKKWIIFFADGGSLALRTGYAYPLSVRWLNVDEGRWHPAIRQSVGPTLSLKTINERGRWIAVVQNMDPLATS